MSTLSKATVCNMALAHIGSTKGISSFDTDTSTEANMCRLFYDQVLLGVLESCSWPFARRRSALGLVEAKPNDDWLYSYRYPSDAERILAVSTESAFINLMLMPNSTLTTNLNEQLIWKLPPFEVAGDSAGKLIFSNMSSAWVYYIKNISDPSRWPHQFAEAIALGLAAKIAMPIAKDPGIAAGVYAMYDRVLSIASASQLNESPTEFTEDSEIVRAYT